MLYILIRYNNRSYYPVIFSLKNKCKCCYDLSLLQIMMTVQHQKLIPLLSIVLEAAATYVT